MSDTHSFKWMQALRRGLSPYTTNTKSLVVSDAKALIDTLDFNEVARVQRIMRKDRRTDADLQRLRDLNRQVDNIVKIKSTQSNTRLHVNTMSPLYLNTLFSDLEALKKKTLRSERRGVVKPYEGKLTQHQLQQRYNVMVQVGMVQPRTTQPQKIWDITDSSLLNNQFGTVPSLTLACLTKQSGHEMNDVVCGLVSLGLLYTVKFPNLTDLEHLAQQHPCLHYITAETSSLNVSGYNFSLNAAVKAGAALLDGGNMLETINLTPANQVKLLIDLVKIRNEHKMFVSDQPGRNPYENLLYKVCLSAAGWPYISSRSQIVGRSWDNVTIDNRRPEPEEPKPTALLPVSGGNTEAIRAEVKKAMEQFDPEATIWIDMEGSPNDPVELAMFQPEKKIYAHCVRKPVHEKAFKDQSRHCHGILLEDLDNTTQGVMSAMIMGILQNKTLYCQGQDDIRKILDSHSRGDVKLMDVMFTTEKARKYEHSTWDEYDHLCNKHKGVVVHKKKENGSKTATAHCALLDCIMFESATKDQQFTGALKNILPEHLTGLQKHSITL